MRHYIIRLDDASDYMDIEKWNRIEKILDKYGIKPIFGVIPQNKDEALISKYKQNPNFWELIHEWIAKGWVPAMHGFEHKYSTNSGGINPVNKRSEFAGLEYKLQAEKIKKGYQILKDQSIMPEIFFAPSHTFDENTLIALRNETPIRIISDTVSWDIYKSGDFWFIPQQSGRVRELPFKTVTFCYHPNTMSEDDFDELDRFAERNRNLFAAFKTELLTDRKRSFIDNLLGRFYYMMHR